MNLIRRGYNGQKTTPKFRNTFYIGVEIECIVSNRSKFYRLLKQSSLKKCFYLKQDSSVRKYITTKGLEVELNVLLTKKNYVSKLKELSIILRKVKAWTNKSCGLHVHLDTYNVHNKTDVHRKLMLLTQAIKSIIPEHRINNDYVEYSTALAEKTQHYNWCNITNLNTLEIRAHEGTVNMKEVTRWIKLLLTIFNMELPMELIRSCKEWENYYHAYRADLTFERIKLDKGTKQYVNNRLHLFNYGIKKEEYYV